jgi:hypothetical protein
MLPLNFLDGTSNLAGNLLHPRSVRNIFHLLKIIVGLFRYNLLYSEQ